MVTGVTDWVYAGGGGVVTGGEVRGGRVGKKGERDDGVGDSGGRGKGRGMIRPFLVSFSYRTQLSQI